MPHRTSTKKVRAKSLRVPIRFRNEEEKELVKTAAEIMDWSINKFMLRTGLEAANLVIKKGSLKS